MFEKQNERIAELEKLTPIREDSLAKDSKESTQPLSIWDSPRLRERLSHLDNCDKNISSQLAPDYKSKLASQADALRRQIAQLQKQLSSIEDQIEHHNPDALRFSLLKIRLERSIISYRIDKKIYDSEESPEASAHNNILQALKGQ